MSHIGFESGQGRVEVGGSERAHMGILIDDVGWVVRSLSVPRSGFVSPAEQEREKLAFRYSDDGENTLGVRLGLYCMLTDEPATLLAHIHGQCEINGWVHPDDLEWFAGLVDAAADRGLLRSGTQSHYGSWRDVADLARRSSTPLVSDYSVTSRWPDPWLITQYRPDLFSIGDDEDSDKWYALSDDERERIAAEALPSCCPRWQPTEWGTHWAAMAVEHITDATKAAV